MAARRRHSGERSERVSQETPKTTQTGFSVKAGSVTGNPLYNEWTGTEWTTTEIGTNNYVLYHVFAINGYTGQPKIVSVMGQNEYGTIVTARSGATTELSSILTQFPFQEIVPIGTVIYQGSTLYANDLSLSGPALRDSNSVSMNGYFCLNCSIEPRNSSELMFGSIVHNLK